jgi:hypothetical protein
LQKNVAIGDHCFDLGVEREKWTDSTCAWYTLSSVGGSLRIGPFPHGGSLPKTTRYYGTPTIGPCEVRSGRRMLKDQRSGKEL